MTIAELRQIADTVYQNNSYAHEENGAMWLLDLHIDALETLMHTGKIHHNQYHLTDLEALSVVMLEECASRLIQSSIYNPNLSNAFTKILVENLDSALLKTPQNSHSVLYSNGSYEREDNKIGDVFTVHGFFTTSVDDFDNTHSIKWIIKPLPENQTKAHELYRVYDHCAGYPYPEYQVEFERNTSFIIKDIIENNDYKTIYINELPS